MKSRDAELEALATAQKILAELAAGATEIVLASLVLAYRPNTKEREHDALPERMHSV